RRHDLIWGAGARFSAGRIPVVVPTITFNLNQRLDKLFSAFAQDEVTLVDNRVWLTLGSKFVRTDFSGWNAQPSARLLWAPYQRHSLWMAATRALRTPSDVEETFDATGFVAANPLTILRLQGNRDFRPETLLGYEAGYRGTLHSTLYIDVAAFRNQYHDLL